MKAAAITLLATLFLSSFSIAETFWNKDKSRSFEGTFLRMDGDKYVFERENDGKTFTLSADKLAPESLALIAKLQEDPAEPAPAAPAAPAGGPFVFRDGGLLLSAVPTTMNLEAVFQSLDTCKFLTKNDSFLEFPGDTAFQPQSNAKAYNLRWLDRDWVVVAQHPNIVNSMALLEFLYFLPESAEYSEDDTMKLQQDIDVALTKVAGIPTKRYTLWSLHPSIRGNDPGGKTPQYFKTEAPGKTVGIGYYRYSYQPKRMVCLYTTPYGRVEVK